MGDLTAPTNQQKYCSCVPVIVLVPVIISLYPAPPLTKEATWTAETENKTCVSVIVFVHVTSTST
jgi:hypothetical protein